MTLPSFVEAARTLERLRVPVVGLAGGEPTLHPRFTDFLETVSKMRFMFIVVLTNGLFTDQSWIEDYGRLKGKETGILFNVRSPKTYSEKEWNLLNGNMKASAEVMPQNIAVGATLNKEFTEEEELIDLMLNHGIFDLRISLSAPSYDYSNNYVHKHDLKFMGKMIANIVGKCLDERILTHIDCPIPACAFDEDDFFFVRRWIDRFRHKCTMPPLDITPDLRIWYCSSMRDRGMEDLKLSDLKRFNSLGEVYLEIERRLINLGIRNQPLFDKCLNCDKWQMCMGGCLKLKTQTNRRHSPPKKVRKGILGWFR